jgi:predicted transcriptional regulator
MNRIFSLLRSSTLKTQLGPLEQELMEKLWDRQSSTVRELLEDGKMQLAYTTVMTTLDRLYKKELLDRVAAGRAFRYSPRYSKGDLQMRAAGEAIRDLLSSDASSMPLSCLVDVVSEHDAEALDELQQLIERKRRELQNRESGSPQKLNSEEKH